jgi:hypothetical protein
MIKRLLNLVKPKSSPPTPVQATRCQQQDSSEDQRPGIFDLPHGCTPIDSVIEGVKIPGTDILVGNMERVIETNRQERIEFKQRQGGRGSCGHMFFDISEISGTCIPCLEEAYQLYSQGLISQQQAEQYPFYCHKCASYCMNCFSQRLCARHTKLFQEPTGRIIPLCPSCHKQLTQSLFGKLISLITGK